MKLYPVLYGWPLVLAIRDSNSSGSDYRNSDYSGKEVWWRPWTLVTRKRLVFFLISATTFVSLNTLMLYL